MQISRWAISAKDHSATRQEVIRLDKNLIRSLDFCATDSCFLIPDYLGGTDIGKSITMVNLSEASVKCLPKKIWLRKSTPALAQAWRSFIDYNPHNGILAMVHPIKGIHRNIQYQRGIPIPYYTVRTANPGLKSIKVKASRPELWDSTCVITDKYIYSVFQGIPV